MLGLAVIAFCTGQYPDEPEGRRARPEDMTGILHSCLRYILDAVSLSGRPSVFHADQDPR